MMTDAPSEPSETTSPDTVTVTYTKKEYTATWRNYWRSVEVRLWVLVSFGLMGLTMLGVIAWWTGNGVLPVVVHVEFQFPLALTLFLVGIILYSAVWILLIGKVSTYALNFRRQLEDPVYPPVHHMRPIDFRKQVESPIQDLNLSEDEH